MFDLNFRTTRAGSRLAAALGTAWLVVALVTPARAQHSDVLLQTVDGKIVTGAANHDNNTWTLGTRVYCRHFLPNFRSSDPGFTGFAYGNPNLPPGANGFPSNFDVNFDIVPMTIGQTVSNLFYWDGSDPGGDGVDESDVAFVIPAGVSWDVYDDRFILYSAMGTDQLVPGGLIQKTSADIDPLDGVDSGAIHNHLVLQLSDNDEDDATTPPAGIYMIAWQARAVGFETSDPFVFVHRTSTVSDAVRDLAADWVVTNLTTLFPPALAGDYNEDGMVDAADYTVWRDRLNQVISLPNEAASPKVVDFADYDVWKANFGWPAGEGAGGKAAMSVPEPAAGVSSIAAIMLVASLARLRRARRGLESAPLQC